VLKGLEKEAREAKIRLVGRSAAGAAVGVAEEEIANTTLDPSHSISFAFSP
jgi:hypothetical protein